MKPIYKQDFYNSLTEKNSVLDSYNMLVSNYLNINQTIFESNEKPTQNLKATSISLFPSYLKPIFKNNDELIIHECPQKKINGYAIVINEKKNIEDFLKTEYSKKFRTNIKRLSKRLETCFDINYKFIYGNILKNEYDFLMNALNEMLIKRFNQRNEKNKTLKNWTFYLETTFELINSKKASLFVIYNDKEPIHICINHHFKDILFVSIPSYNIDYSKFALGNISIHKLLEWSLNNNYSLLDMAYGDLEYKRRWSNLIYSFNHHIISPKNKIPLVIKAKIEIAIITLKNILKKYNIDTFINKIKAFRQKRNTIPFNSNYKIVEFLEFDKTNCSLIDLKSHKNPLLKKLAYDTLYNYKTHINHIMIYKNMQKDEYYLISDSIKLQITFFKL